MDPVKKRCLMETFITFQFSDYLFIWMFHNRKLNRWLNRIPQRAFRLIYNNNYQFSFSELLEKENSISTHNRIMQVLDVEIYILKIDIAPEIMKDLLIFKKRSHNLSFGESSFAQHKVEITYGLYPVRYLSLSVWNKSTYVWNCRYIKHFKSYQKLEFWLTSLALLQ